MVDRSTTPKSLSMPLVLAALTVVSIGLLLASAAVGVLHDVPFSTISRDTFQTADVPVWVGLASNLGVFLWLMAGAVAVFAGLVLVMVEGPSRPMRFLGLGGMLSMLLALDDFFMLHELGYGLGLPEKLIYAGYGLLAAALFTVFRDVVTGDRALRPLRVLLVVALSLVTLSLVVDAAQEILTERLGEWRIFVEDGLKFQGVVWWSGYFVLASWSVLVDRVRGGNSSGDPAAV